MNFTHVSCHHCGVLMRHVPGRELCLACARAELAIEERRPVPDFDRIGHFRAQARCFLEAKPA